MPLTTGTSLTAGGSLFLSPYYQVGPLDQEKVRIPGTRNRAASADLRGGVHEYCQPHGRRAVLR